LTLEANTTPLRRLSELLGLAVPTLPSLQNTLNPSFVTSGAASGGGTGSAEELGPQSLWADEEEKKFYEELRELRGEVPASILGVPEEEKAVEEKSSEEKSDEVIEENPLGDATEDHEEETKDEEAVDEDALEAEKAAECVPTRPHFADFN
jgi:regulator of nonsense transcripts 2